MVPVPAAIYARVSTGEQSTEQQVTALREAADRMRLDPVLVVEETGSGAKADRPGLLRVMAPSDAARSGPCSSGSSTDSGGPCSTSPATWTSSVALASASSR